MVLAQGIYKDPVQRSQRGCCINVRDNVGALGFAGSFFTPILRLTTSNLASLLAPVGQDGKIGRNTFRAGNLLELDLSPSKSFAFTDRYRLALRMDIFTFINRDNFAVPVRFLEAPGFGQATETVTPGRRIQTSLELIF